MNYMRQTTLLIFCIALAMITASCRACPSPPLNGEIELPTPTTEGTLPFDNAAKLILGKVSEHFIGCSDKFNGNKKYYYAYDGYQKGYLTELGQLEIIIKPYDEQLINGASPAQERDGIDWRGFVYLNANYTKRFDIGNRSEFPAEDGTTLQIAKLNFEHKRGKLKCDNCQFFKRPSSCKEVETELKKIADAQK